MHSVSFKKILSLMVVALFAAAIFTAQATAGPKDRNGNNIPDAWEKAQGLSVKKDQGNRDADGDGARNRCEYQAKTDPNNADSDTDGTVDGDEDTDGDGATNRAESNLRSNCGRANSHLQLRRGSVVSLTEGVLVIAVKGGGTVTAPLSSSFRCTVKPAETTVETSAAGDGPKSRPNGCTTADLVADVKVHNARTKSGKFVAVTIVR